MRDVYFTGKGAKVIFKHVFGSRHITGVPRVPEPHREAALGSPWVRPRGTVIPALLKLQVRELQWVATA